MIPVPKKTYSRKANQTSSSESSFSYTKYSNDESEKENKRNEARQSKNKAIKKIKQDVLEDSFETNVEGPADKTEELFEKLLSSPPKVEVNYKPLSFWARKVQGLEAENPVKKKCQLYELSDSDESCSPELRKKKVKRKPGVRKKKTANFNYDFNKLYSKKPNKKEDKTKPSKTKPDKTQEGFIIKERVLLKKEEEKLADKENKFTFNKNSSLMGITSTPGRDKINIVGASNFSFFSPIQNLEATPLIKPPNFDISSIRNEEEEKIEEQKTIVETTPVIRKSTRLRTKRVSEDDNSYFSHTLKNVTVENFSNPFSGFNSGDLKSSEPLDLPSVCSSRYEDANNITSLHEDISNPKDNENEVYVSESVSNSQNSAADSEKDLSFTSAKTHCSVSEPEQETLNLVEIGRKVVLLLQLNFAMRSEYCESLLSRCTNFSMGMMRMWKSVENVCENEHPCHYSDDEDNDGEFVFGTENVFQNSNNSFSESENKSVNTIIEQTFDNNYSVEEKETKEESNNSLNQSLERNFCNVTVRRRYNNFSRVQLTREESNNSQNESSNEISNLNQTVVKIEKLEETLQRLSIDPPKDHSQESSQYLSKLSFRKSFNNKKFNKIGNDSSIMESSPDVSNRTVVNANSIKEESNEPEGKISPENLEIPNEEAPKYLSPVLDSSICIQNKLMLTPTSSKSLVIDETISSPIPIFESTVCEPGNQMLESTARLSSFKNYRKSRKPFKRDVRTSDWNITKISECPEDDSLPPPLLESTAVPDVLGEAQNFSVNLKAGKKWARSMSILRQFQNGSILEGNEKDGSSIKGRNYKSFVKEVLDMQPAAFHESVLNPDLSKTIGGLTVQMSNLSMSRPRRSFKVVPTDTTTAGRDSLFRTALGLVKTALDLVEEEEKEERTLLNVVTVNKTTAVGESFLKKALDLVEEEEEEEEEDEIDCQSKDDTIVENITLKELKKSITARDVVLARCNQEEPVPFEENFNERTLKNCRKIGEGVYGEVFMYNSDTVIKIIPIEGSEMVNGDRQKKFDEILSEIVIAMELSNLRNGQENRTTGFNELKRCWCVVGEYPQYLIDLWEEFDRKGNGSENDHPSMFKSDQLYIVLELANGGKDLEAFVFNSAEQSLSVFVQTAYILAVAEKALEFEHRDLHWGNLLISSTKEKTSSFLLDGVEFKIPLKGVKVSIIDFTLSRMTYEGCCIFNDLSVDPELFTAQGDYQFEIYRLMQNEVGNNWSLHKPKTNVYWLHYILDKMISMVRYKNTSTKTHKTSIKKIKDLKASMLDYVSCSEFVVNEVP